MAGDWIKMREDLHEDPAVLRMAAELKTRPEHVVGYCHRFWSWLSRSCPDGVLQHLTLDVVGDVISLPGFPDLLVKVGWLEYAKINGIDTITIPNFDRHLSKGAKARALETEKKRKQRLPKMSRKCPDRNGTTSGPEKRREEKRRDSNTPLPPKGGFGLDEVRIPPELDSVICLDSLRDWLAHKRSIGKAYKSAASVEKLLAQWADQGPAAFCAAVAHSIAQNYQGVYPPNGQRGRRQPTLEDLTSM